MAYAFVARMCFRLVWLSMHRAAGVAYVMGVPGADDVMLNYQSTSFHDALYLREVMGLKRAPEFEAWLEKMEIVGSDGRLAAAAGSPLLAAVKELGAAMPNME